MATKTVVCPECQSPAAPGRYACAECGALLASVAFAPRIEKRERRASSRAGRSTGPAMDDRRSAAAAAERNTPATMDPPPADAGDIVAEADPSVVVSPAWTQSLAVEPADTRPTDDERWDDEPLTDVVGEDSGSGPAVGSTLATDVDATVEPEPEAGPVSAPVATYAPGPAARAPDPAALAAIAPLAAGQAPAGLTAAGDADADVDARQVAARRAVAPFASQPVPTWPPEGAGLVFAEPIRRPAAGAYLPPSAVLPAGEALTLAGPVGAPRETTAPPPVADSGRLSAAARLEQLGFGADTPRRVVGLGAVIAGLGFLLPWASILAGSGLLGDYWTQWGIAGPGHWIVVVLLAALATVALARGRTETWPVGLPAVAIAALLLGLCWPYLFGFLGRSVGIWVVLAGAILLAAGGLLDLRRDHHTGAATTV